MFKIAPSPLSKISGRNTCVIWAIALQLRSTIPCTSATSSRWNSPATPYPAQLITTSTFKPSCRTFCSNSCPASGRRRSTSTANIFTPTPSSRRSMLFASLATSTRARRGFCSSNKAICRPIPLDAPVNSTTLSRKVRMVARLPTRNGVSSLPLGKGNVSPGHVPLKGKFQRKERGFKRPIERKRIHGLGELATRQKWSSGLGTGVVQQ